MKKTKFVCKHCSHSWGAQERTTEEMPQLWEEQLGVNIGTTIQDARNCQQRISRSIPLSKAFGSN